MYKIKQKPQDFIVKELSMVEIGNAGSYSYYLLRKEEWTTLDAVREIAKRAHIPVKFIGFAGNKDKMAITEQVISVKNNKKLEGLKIKDVELEFLGRGKERVNLGDLKGNEFIITIRDLDNELRTTPSRVPNYFDDQRFGKDGNTHIIGKAIIMGDFEKATELIDNSEINDYLENNKNDYVGALKKTDKKLLRLYIHAYESYLWNLCVSEYLSKWEKFKMPYSLGNLSVGITENREVPLLGFLTELEGDTKPIYENIMEKEGISQKDFVVRKIPELTSEGSSRPLFMEVKDYKVLKYSEGSQKVSFQLPKGSYATLVIKYLYFKEKSL